MMLRRRATPLGQKIAISALGCGHAVRDARYVLASRHGEFSRLLGILDALAQDELPSPTDFSMSVHHAMAGLLSIHAGNTAGHTALAAGADTFGMALLEAASCIAEQPDEPVLLLYGDEPLSGAYAGFCDEDTRLPLVAAFALSSPVLGERAVITALEPRGSEAASPGTTGCAARDFLRFLLSDAASAISHGDRIGWRWHRVD